MTDVYSDSDYSKGTRDDFLVMTAAPRNTAVYVSEYQLGLGEVPGAELTIVNRTCRVMHGWWDGLCL
jgi:hypothetical protein